MSLVYGAVDIGFSNEVEASFFIVLLALFTIGLIFILLSFTLYAWAMFGIARKEGLSKPWLALIPVVNLLMIPRLVEYDVHEQMQGHFVKIFAATYAVSLLFGGMIPLIFVIPSALLYYGFYFIADRYSERPWLHMVLLVVTGGASLAFQLFRFRKRESLYEDEFDLADL